MCNDEVREQILVTASTGDVLELTCPSGVDKDVMTPPFTCLLLAGF